MTNIEHLNFGYVIGTLQPTIKLLANEIEFFLLGYKILVYGSVNAETFGLPSICNAWSLEKSYGFIEKTKGTN